MQSVEAAFEQRDAVAAKFAALFDHRLEQRLHGVAPLAHGHDAGHARATLDGVQVALQPDQRLAFGGALAQLREQAVGMIKQVPGLLDEDVDKLGIQVAKDRKSVVWGKSVSVRVDLGGGRIIKKKKCKNNRSPKQ